MTAQLRDSVLVDGIRMQLTGRNYPTSTLHIPSSIADKAKEGDADDGLMSGTWCHRGYVASWSIEHGRLHLLDIHGGRRLRGPAPAFAWWYSGTVHVGGGELLIMGMYGMDAQFEQERIYTIQYGIVRAVRRIEHTPETAQAAFDAAGSARRNIGFSPEVVAFLRGEGGLPTPKPQPLPRIVKRDSPRPWNEWPPHPDQLAQLFAVLNLRASMAQSGKHDRA
jgi:hypothetical protein